MKNYKGHPSKLHTEYINANQASLYPALFELVETIYQDILELDLDSETIFFLRNCEHPEQEGHHYPFVHEADTFCNYRIMAEDTPLAKKTLSLEELHKFYDSGAKRKSLELRVCARNFIYEWVELSLFSLSHTVENKPKILITVRNINDQKIMRGIIDRFVYDSCDYFIYLDTKSDSYMMFSGSDNGTPLPPTNCDNYSSEIIKYARDFVVPEDQDYTIEQMNLAYIQKMLDAHGEHVFYCGIIDPIRGYTRKCLRYLYYDKANKMVLLIRTDVTDVYLLEKEKTDQLRQALEEARTDSLTEIYNRKATETLIRETITAHQDTSTGAFFFIDIDNFKQVNDLLGHNQGDFLLRFLSQKLKGEAPAQSIIGRLGGDEFIVYCPEMNTSLEMETLAHKFCCSFDTICDERLVTIGVGCSVGIAVYPKDGLTYETLCEHADRALYISKNKKKKQFTFYHTEQAQIVT